MAARVEMFLYRVSEELYDFATDPAARVNLIDDPAYAGQLNDLRACLEEHLDATDDPALDAFRARDDPDRAQQLLTDMVRSFDGN